MTIDGSMRRYGSPSLLWRWAIVQSSGDREAVKRRVKTGGGRIVRDHELIQGFTATVRVQQLEALANEPDVDRVSIDAVVAADATYSLLATEGLPAAATVARSTTLTGASVRVAIIDSGLEITADLGSNRIIGFYDFTTRGVVTTPYDDYGHGTHVSGLIAGDGSKS